MKAGDVIAEARRIADEVLFPAAQDVDRADCIPTSHLAALAAAGLYGMAGPVEYGSPGIEFADARRVMAAVASGCGATYFTWVQHHMLVLQLAASENAELRAQLLGDLCAGRTTAGVVFAHLRRLSRPLQATRVEGGWRLDGAAPWATGWGIADYFLAVAESPAGEAVWVVIDGTDQPGLTVSTLALPVLMATRTMSMDFDGLAVADPRVVTVESADGWRTADRVRSAIGGSHVYGLADRAIRLLAEFAHDADDPAAQAAERLRADLEEQWRDDDALLGEMMSGRPRIEVMSDHRAAGLDLARRATSALLAAVGGRGMTLDHPAQRLAREADFYVIQAQTVDGRAAVLRSS